MSFQHHEFTSPLRSQSGQMAIFIALIFQVLFVFFAMIVNVGLIVHDKINLQNSVDLAAYYGAQRQAEILNAIAHQNYEVRQAWKLLSWRIRVLGDMGYQYHPIQLNLISQTMDLPAFGNASEHKPVICINHSMWGRKQNVCSNPNIRIPDLPALRVINPFFPYNFGAAIGINALKKTADEDGKDTGPMNFNIALRWARAYRVQIAKSKGAMRQYADLLSKDPTDFKDIYGKSASMGALKTLQNNLTRANSKALANGGEKSYSFYNSLGKLGDRKQWLNEVPIYPLIYYADLYKAGKTFEGDARLINGTGLQGRSRNDQTANPEDDVFRNEPMNVNDPLHSIFGAEKNPWMMAYVGVYAETKPRKPYLPFGEPITLKAKAFAKPFGGRIGPWYYTKWPKGSKRSAGDIQNRTDLLAPIPTNEEGELQASDKDRNLAVPNYSRYPGDRLGLTSTVALSLFKNILSSKKLQPGYYSGTPSGGDGLAMGMKTDREFLSYNQILPNLKYPAPWIRELEVAAIAPDLFDITYYSIDRDSYHNYSKPSVSGNIISEIPYDIGSIHTGEAGVRNIADQITIAKEFSKGPMSFWVIKNPSHLLTGWAPSDAFEYKFPGEVFGKCLDESSDKIPVPGGCARGGRVGYSVKIISEEYLKSNNLPLGGQGIMGPIDNPPGNWPEN